MNPLDTLIREYVVPVMKAAGFAKKGRSFRLTAPHGDTAVVLVDADAVDPEKYVFDVSAWMVPLPYWEFLHREFTKTSVPNASGALATFPVVPPRGVAHQPDDDGHFRNRWAFAEPDTRDVCGRELARVLTEDAIPRMVRLLDRRTLLEETRTNPNDGLVRLKDEVISRIVLRVDDDPVGDLTALIDKAEADGLFPPFATWARERLARRTAKES
ncbi:hypothetical protein [Streptomyces sp. NPDC057257]|uniref:hypothetical protein n=1 Tax=Streptomyces sp. NPDC057257 TaxID=3346071 RepID=UPI003638190F